MAIYSLLIGLQAWRKDGRGVSSREFLDPLRLLPREVESYRADGGPWSSGFVTIATIRLSDYDHVDDSADAGAPNEAFHAGIGEAFLKAARFLDAREPAVTEAMRRAGLSLSLFVEPRMAQDQMDMRFPPELLSACGRHGLEIFLITNDVSAAEVMAARAAGGQPPG